MDKNQSIVTLEALGQAQTDMASWVRAYVEAAIAHAPTPIDPTSEAVKQALDQLNGEIIGTTSWEKVSAALAVKTQMQGQFTTLGFSQAGVLANYPSFINRLSRPTGVFIEDTNGNLWTASDWTTYRVAEVAKACVVITSSLSFRIGFHMYSNIKQSASNVMWYGMPLYQTVNDAYAESRTPLDLTKTILANLCPAMLGQDKSGANYSKTRLIANLPTTGHYYDSLADFQEVTSGNVNDVYVVNYAGTTDGSNMHVYYWSGAEFIDTGVKPTTLDANIGARVVWQYSAYVGDDIQWHEPNMAWLRAMYQNITAIDECFTAVNGSAINKTYTWSDQQQNVNNGWYFSLSSGGTGTNNKTNACAMFPFSAYE